MNDELLRQLLRPNDKLRPRRRLNLSGDSQPPGPAVSSKGKGKQHAEVAVDGQSSIGESLPMKRSKDEGDLIELGRGEGVSKEGGEEVGKETSAESSGG